MKGIAAAYPKYDAQSKKIIDIEQRINLERTERMGAVAFPWESDQLLSMTAYVKIQSRGMPVDVSIDGPARAAWQDGKNFFEARRGQLDTVVCPHGTVRIDLQEDILRW